LKRFNAGLLTSSILAVTFSYGLTDSNDESIAEFLEGRFIFLLELGLTFISGRKD
jgi:hypothetical protein